MGNQPQSLFKLLSCFALRGLSVSRIESRPACTGTVMFTTESRFFDYLFFVDVVFTNHESDAVQKAVANVEEYADKVRHLGTYLADAGLSNKSTKSLPWT